MTTCLLKSEDQGELREVNAVEHASWQLTRDVEVEVDEKSRGIKKENTDRELNYQSSLPYDEPRLLVPVEVACWMSVTKSENDISKGTHRRQTERTS